MSMLRMTYLTLAIVGAIKPMIHFMGWLRVEGNTLFGMIDAWTVNEAARGLMWDLTIAAVALTVWIIAEVYVRKDYWIAPVCIAATFCIGVSCGLPLYLFLRTRPLA